MQSNFKKFLSLGILIIIFAISISFFTPAKGNISDNISGFAWEADNWVDKNSNGSVDANEVMATPGGTEWISFNCTNTSSCGTIPPNINYGVNVDPNTGHFSGYAWSPHYGWLSFNETSGFPSGGGTTPSRASINFNGGSVNARPMAGWARFCAVYASGCNGPLANNRGGWDGWVSFSGTGYGVTLDMSSATKAFNGYAWGGNGCTSQCNDPSSGNVGKNVLGWISFNNVLYTPPGTPTVDINAAALGNKVYQLSWTGLHLAGGNTCNGTQTGPSTVPGWTGAHLSPPPERIFNTNALVDGTYVFTITCNGSPAYGGGTATDSVTVIVGIDLSFSADSNTVYPPSFQTTLNWNSSPVNAPLTNCVPSSSPAVSAWNNLTIADLPPGGSALVTVPPNSNPTRFTLTCHDGGNTIVKYIDLNRDTLPESLTFTSDIVKETSPGSGVYNTTLTWVTQNISPNSCVGSNGSSSWNTPSAKSNPQTGSNSQSNVIVPGGTPPPLVSTTYTLSCTRLNVDSQILCPTLYPSDTTKICANIILNQKSGTTTNTKRPIFKEN